MKTIFDRMVMDQANSLLTADTAEIPPSQDNATNDVSDTALRTSSKVKEVTQELLKHGYVEETRKPELFRRVLVHKSEILTILEPLDLDLRLDSHRGVAFLVVAHEVSEYSSSEDSWSHPLVRRQRLTLEQSLLIAILRQAFVMHEHESGIGQCAANIAVEDLLPHFLTYLGDSGSDAKNESRLLILLDQLKTYGIVSEVDKNQEVTIRPLITHLANPESLASLLVVLQQHVRNVEAPEHEE